MLLVCSQYEKTKTHIKMALESLKHVRSFQRSKCNATVSSNWNWKQVEIQQWFLDAKSPPSSLPSLSASFDRYSKIIQSKRRMYKISNFTTAWLSLSWKFYKHLAQSHEICICLGLNKFRLCFRIVSILDFHCCCGCCGYIFVSSLCTKGKQ